MLCAELFRTFFSPAEHPGHAVSGAPVPSGDGQAQAYHQELLIHVNVN